MEACNPGGMEIIKTLMPFPGIGETGQRWGAINESLIVFCLYSGSDDGLNR